MTRTKVPSYLTFLLLLSACREEPAGDECPGGRVWYLDGSAMVRVADSGAKRERLYIEPLTDGHVYCSHKQDEAMQRTGWSISGPSVFPLNGSMAFYCHSLPVGPMTLVCVREEP